MHEYEVEIGYTITPHYSKPTRFDTFRVRAESTLHARSYAIDKAHAKYGEVCNHVTVISAKRV